MVDLMRNPPPSTDMPPWPKNFRPGLPAKSLDVVIGDQSAIDHYETVSAYQNLEELLPPELYERVKDHIYRAKDGEGNLTPVALSLEDTALGEKTGIIHGSSLSGRHTRLSP